MASSRLALLVGLTLTLLVAHRSFADPDDTGFKNSLALQTAMGQARHFLVEGGNPQKAIEVLEKELPRVNGNAAFLNLLRDAYRAYIKELWLAHQADLAGRYLERLCIIDPSAAHDPELRRPLPPPTKEQAAAADQKPAPIYPDFQKNNPLAKKAETLLTASTAKLAAANVAPASVPAAAVRGKIEDVPDPFALRRPDPREDGRSSDVLTRADEEFRQKHYAEARQLYEKALKDDAAALNADAPRRERYAYCLFDQVTTQLKDPGQAAKGQAELKKKVQTALDLAPRLNNTARWLQREIDNRAAGITEAPQVSAAGSTPQVQHLGRNREGWTVAETTNFRIFHHQDNAFAERVAAQVERTRLEMYRKWFGSDGVVWTPKCEIILHPSADSYSHMTSVPGTSPGHSRIESDPSGQRVVGRRMDLRLDSTGALEAVLPHEATHVVLAGQFGPFPVPRWADEGMAVLSEPSDKIAQHRQNVRRYESELFDLRELMDMKDYPQARRVSAFYAQSVVLVEFLTNLKGSQEFVEFVRDGLRHGYEMSLRRHYGMDFAELDSRWRQQVLGETNRVAARDRE